MGDDIDDVEPLEGTSFWEPHGYKRTTKRITDGNTLCNELVEMTQERCEIEAKYASYLKNWSKRWGEKIDKGPEYGSMESAWKAVLTAADREADVHIRVKDNLINVVQNEVRKWQKDNFHKGMMSLHFKEKKDTDEEFRKAQKPWAKKLKIVEKYKAEYHGLCLKEQSALNREKNARNDAGFSEDARAKITDEVTKLGSLKLSAKASYEDALKDLNSYNPRYMEDMKEVYLKCQAMENRRLDFFKERLLAMHQTLDLSDDIVMKQIYADYLVGVDAANAKSDLKWWDMQRGMDMPMNWPQFEEPSQRMGEITSGTSIFRLRPNGETSTISGGTFRKKTEETTTTTTVTNRFSTISTPGGPSNGVNGTSNLSVQQRSAATSRDSINRHSNSRESVNSTNPFGSDDEEETKGYEEGSRLSSPGLPRYEAPAQTVVRPVAPPTPPMRESLYPALPVESPSTSVPEIQVEEVVKAKEFIRTEDSNPFGGDDDSDVPESPVAPPKPRRRTESEEKDFEANPFSEEWSESPEALEDHGKAGVRVRALYSYGGEESDELTFREGEVFEKIEDRDEQGWAKGRKDGKVGLFPADYVEPV